MLAICLGVLTAGPLIEVSATRAHFHGTEGPGCLLGDHLGETACPGCGLTRGTALVLQGRWQDAWTVHAGGFVVAILCGVGVPLHLDILRRREVRPAHRRLRRWGRILLLVGIVAPWLLAPWISRALTS